MTRRRRDEDNAPHPLDWAWGVALVVVLFAVGIYDLTVGETLFKFGPRHHQAEGSTRTGAAALANGAALIALGLALHAHFLSKRIEPRRLLLRRANLALIGLFLLLALAAHIVLPVVQKYM